MVDLSAPVVTIDGPSGTGKGTMAYWLAEKLGWHFLDSGALYRVVAWCYIHFDYVSVSAFVDDLGARVDMTQVSFAQDSGRNTKLSYAGEDITAAIRTEVCAQRASILAAKAEVRDFLTKSQKDFQLQPGLVADGRDMGTVIFPKATLKFFLTASAQVRAQRRYQQLKAQDVDADLSHLIQELRERDLRDSTREVAKLVPAADAIVIETGDLSIKEVQSLIWQQVQAHDLHLTAD